MLDIYKNGQGSIIIRFKVLDALQTFPAGKTGITEASADLIISTIVDNEAVPVVYTQAAGNIETIAALGTYVAPTAGKCRLKEVDPVNHKGVYELQIADSRFAVAGAKSLLVSVAGVTNMIEVDFPVSLIALDLQDGAAGGMSRLDTNTSSRAAPGAAMILTAVYDAAKTAAQAGDQMDLVNVPNAVAITAIGAALEAMMLDEGDASALLASIGAKVEEFLVNEGDATATIAAIATACNLAITASHGVGSYLTGAGGGGGTDLLSINGDTDSVDRLQAVLKGNVICTIGVGSTLTNIITSSLDPAAVVADQFKSKIFNFAKDTTTAELRGQSAVIESNTAAGILTFAVGEITVAPVNTDTGTVS